MMGGMDDLVVFLRARLDEDAAVARDATPGPWEWRQEHGEPWRPEPDGLLDYSGEYLETGGETPTLFEPGMTPHADAVHIARHDPARVLADIDAKRRILDTAHRSVYAPEAEMSAEEALGEEVLRLLALPYADHPGYRDEWRP